jgi:hypothetical protein
MPGESVLGDNFDCAELAREIKLTDLGNRSLKD